MICLDHIIQCTQLHWPHHVYKLTTMLKQLTYSTTPNMQYTKHNINSTPVQLNEPG